MSQPSTQPDPAREPDPRPGTPPARKVITYEGKKYTFEPWQILLLAVATPVFVIVFYELLEYAAWIRIIVADHTISSLNFITAMGATLQYSVRPGILLEPGSPWITTFTTYTDLFRAVGLGPIFFSWVSDITILFGIPGRGSIQFVTFCTGFQAIIIFAALIFFTPHSKDPGASKGVWQRKIASLFWSSLIFYVVNLARMWIQLYLYYIGFAWDDIHYSISAASSFIAAIIILLMHRTLPEFVLSIVWAGVVIKDRYFPKLGYKTPRPAAA